MRFISLVWLVAALIGCTACASLTAPARTAPSPSWTAMALADLKFIHEAVATAHPGMSEPADPAVTTWMSRGYEEAQALALRAETQRQAVAAVRYFTVGFADGHLAAAHRKPAMPAEWSGFTVERRNGVFTVVDRADTWPAPLPDLGAQLLAWDGRAPQDIIDQDIVPYVDRRVGLMSVQRRRISSGFRGICAENATLIQRLRSAWTRTTTPRCDSLGSSAKVRT